MAKLDFGTSGSPSFETLRGPSPHDHPNLLLLRQGQGVGHHTYCSRAVAEIGSGQRAEQVTEKVRFTTVAGGPGSHLRLLPCVLGRVRGAAESGLSAHSCSSQGSVLGDEKLGPAEGLRPALWGLRKSQAEQRFRASQSHPGSGSGHQLCPLILLLRMG